MPSPQETTAPKPFVFVLMPFKDGLRDVYDLAIKPAAAEVDAYAERVDDQHFTDSILARIMNQIAKADALVADMTDRNPNVYYEVGYAHALDKPVLLITQEINDIPFDLKDRPHTEYARANLAKLKADLVPKLRAALTDSGFRKGLASPCPIDVRLNGIRLPELGSGEPPKIQYQRRDMSSNFVGADFSMCNVRSPATVLVEQVHLVTQQVNTVGPLGSPGPPVPAWYDSPAATDGFVRRYQFISSPRNLPYYGPFTVPLGLYAPANENFHAIRIELLAQGRRFIFPFIGYWA